MARPRSPSSSGMRPGEEVTLITPYWYEKENTDPKEENRKNLCQRDALQLSYTPEIFQPPPLKVQNLDLISTGGPPVLPPWRWKFRLLLSRNVHAIVRS